MKSRGLNSALSIIALPSLLALLATCSLDTGFRPASGTELPADQVLDVARSFSGPFTFETLLPVALNLTVQLYQQPSPAAALARQTSDSQLIVVSLRDSRGQTLYSGVVPAGGTLATLLSLPAAPQDVVLRLDAPGYEPREVTIDGMVQYSEINRVMGLLSEGLAAKSNLPDTDRDGVPDIYDVDPLNPEVAFQLRTPASGQFTVAFEDLYPVPGDADYNDFAAKYFILENHKSEIPQEDILEMVEEPKSKPIEVMLFNLCGEATAIAKIAGYSHKFGMVIDFPGVKGVQVTRKIYYDTNGACLQNDTQTVNDRAEIWLFENTSKDVVGKTARFEITFPKGTTRSMVSIAPYDPVLLVLNTGKDIHMVGEDPLPSTATTTAPVTELSYMDPNGYPWALLVPEEWQHPAETQYIGNAYPLFNEWRDSKGAKAPYWYLYPASIGTKPGNQAPSQVSSPDSPLMTAGSASEQLFRLLSTDPEADKVTFLSSPAPIALEGFFSLDSESKVARFAPGAPVGDYLFYFWSVDAWGASNIDKPYKVTFSFQSKTANTAPQVSFYDLQVGGAGTTAVNGYYRENGANQGWPLYGQVDGNYYLYYLTTTDFGSRWVIHSSVFSPNTATLGSVTYHAGGLTGTWSRTVNGATPPPSVARAAITGAFASGGVLTATYNYIDAESDADASTYQWKRYGSATDTSAGVNCQGAGATTLNYTMTQEDLTGFLRLEVTPRDARGAAGAPVLSGPMWNSN